MKKTNNLIGLFFMLFLVMFFNVSYCEANSNLTLNDFRNIMKNAGANISNIEIPSDLQTILTTKYPLIIKDAKNNCIRIYPTINKTYTYQGYQNWKIYFGLSDKKWVIGLSDNVTGSQFNYSTDINVGSYPSYGSIYAYKYDLSTNTFSKYDFAKINNNHLYNYSVSIGCEFDANTETLQEFQTIKKLKNYLFNNILFCGQNEIYYNKQNVFYRFNGVITEYYDVYKSQYSNTVGKTSYNDIDLKFRYEVPATYKDNEVGIMDIYLQELSANEVLKQTSKLDKEGYLEKIILTSTENPVKYGLQPVACNIYYNELIKLMEKGKIYRLCFYFYKNVKNESGEIIGNLHDTATSCFFSLNNWKSNDFEIKNIYEVVYDNDPSLLPEDDNKSEDNTSFIIDSIDNVNKNIENTILGVPDGSGDRKGGLLGGILDGIKGFFIPSSEFFNNYFNELNNWFSDRLGLLYFPIDFIISFLNRIYSSEFNNVIFNIPDIYIPGYGKEYGYPAIIPAYKFDFTDFISSNENINTIYNMYLLVVDGIIIWGIIQLFSKKYEEVTTK